jgi:ankyrin repeat protein
MLIDVGGNDLVMAKDKNGNTALLHLCYNIKKHTKAAEKIKLILQVGDANLLLSAKNRVGKTPLEIATDKGASNIIKELLTIQSNFNSTRSSNNPSTNIVPEDNSTPVTQSNQDQDTTRSSSIRGLDVEVGRMKRKHQ